MGVTARGSRRDARIDKTKRSLHASLLALIADRGFETLTAADIARHAGIGYATFFRHYAGPPALLRDVAGDFIDQLSEQIGPAMMAGDGRAAARALARFVEDHLPLCRVLFVGAAEPIRQELIERAIATGHSVPSREIDGVPHELAIVHGVSATFVLLAWWLREDRDCDGLPAVMERLIFTPLSDQAPGAGPA